MALTQDIVATYKGPGAVIRTFLAQGRNEVRLLLFVMITGLLLFVATAPYQAREAQLDPEIPLQARLYWSAFFWIFIMPILLYAFTMVIWAVSRVARRRITGYGVRLTFIWALLASMPVVLLLGLVAGLIGPGMQLQLVGIMWLAVFGWFWLAGLLAAEQEAQ